MPAANGPTRRSGRFKNPNVTPNTIVTASSTTVRIYRFHNTAKQQALDILVGPAASTPVVASLAAGRSIDLVVPMNQVVKVGRGKGVYDLVGSGEIVRSGVFNGAGMIAKLSTQSRLYRVINGSDTGALVVSVGANSSTIAIESSVDIVLTGDVSVAPEAVNGPCEGLFELLGNA